MATRFYFDSTNAPSVSPGFNSNWEQTGQALRRNLLSKAVDYPSTALTNNTVTIPITTTQDILAYQFTSMPMDRCSLGGLFIIVIRCAESATTANAHLAYALRIFRVDGTFTEVASSFATATEFAVTAATRLIGNNTTTISVGVSNQLQAGDRIIVELGIRANAPTAATTGTLRSGTAAATDFAFTSALTTDLNPWCQFTADLTFANRINNHMHVNSGNGMSVGDVGFRR